MPGVQLQDGEGRVIGYTENVDDGATVVVAGDVDLEIDIYLEDDA